MPLIGVVTHLFPLAGEVYRGQAIYKSIRALSAHADVEVLYAQAAYLGKPIPAREYRWDELTVRDIPYRAVPVLSRPLNGRRCARALYPALKKLRCDVILSYWLYPEGHASVAVGRDLGTPVVVSSRGSDLRRIPDPLTRRLVSRTLQQASYVLTVSEDLRRRALALGASPERSKTILNGCDYSVFRPAERAGLRPMLNLPADAEAILYVGRLVADKGILDLLAAFASIARERPRLQLVLIGTGPLEQKIDRFAAAHGLLGQIRRCGSKDPPAVAQWMQAVDLVCLPTYSEGCPNVVLEAISCGCPVVASNVGGIPEVLHPECGIMVPARDRTELAKALTSGLDRPWHRDRISTAFGRTWEDVGRETYQVCRELMPPPRRAQKRPPAAFKIAVVTPYFPTSAHSYRGHSAFHTVSHLTRRVDLEVICPLTAYVGGRWLWPRNYDRPDLSYRPPGIPTSYFEYPAVPLLSRPLNGWICERRLLPYLQRAKPDIILNYWLYPEGLAAIQAGHALGIPTVVGSIGSDLRRIPDPISRRLVRRTLALADGVITVSEDLRRHAIAMGADPAKVMRILNGCDTSVFHPGERQAARAITGAAADTPMVLYVGSLLQSKGLSELIEAFVSLSTLHPGTRLVLIGEGPYRETFIRKATSAGVQGHVMMLGRQTSEAVSDWMRAADVFCLPSHSEGCPNVIVEALACGCPVVATDVGGIPELVNEKCGILVPPHQPEALGAALRSACSRSWDSDGIAATFRRGWKEVADETYDFCRTIVERSRRGASILCASRE